MSNLGKNGECPTIERVFELLDDWRHLPDYQLERRADIFFALFLPEVLKRRFGGGSEWKLIPEFPIKKKKNYQSNRVDYLALSGDLEQALLIELKTDMESIGPKQIKLLKGAACKGIREIIVGLKSITMSDSVKNNTQTRGKYFHLFRALKETGLIKIHDRDKGTSNNRVFSKGHA